MVKNYPDGRVSKRTEIIKSPWHAVNEVKYHFMKLMFQLCELGCHRLPLNTSLKKPELFLSVINHIPFYIPKFLAWYKVISQCNLCPSTPRIRKSKPSCLTQSFQYDAQQIRMLHKYWCSVLWPDYRRQLPLVLPSHPSGGPPKGSLAFC